MQEDQENTTQIDQPAYNDTTQSGQATKNAIEIPESASSQQSYIGYAGIALAVMLIIGLYFRINFLTQISIIIFAIIGGAMVFKEVFSKKTSNTTAITAQPSDSESEPTAQTDPPIKQSSTALKTLSIVILAIVGAIFIFPVIGVVLLIIFMVIAGASGQSMGE